MTQPEKASPDELLESFKGHSIKKIVVFTVIVHAVLILGTSASYFYERLVGADSEGMSEEQRMEEAVREATASIRAIAEKYEVKPQELSNAFTDKKPKAPVEESDETPEADVPPTPPEGGTDTSTGTEDPDKPLSTIEKELQKKEEGPVVPLEEVDLFK